MEKIKDLILKRKLNLKNDRFSHKFICKVCENVIVKAKVTKCGHSFCGKCIMEHLAENSNCPDCGILLNAESNVSNDFQLDLEIEKLIMTCPNSFCDVKLCIGELSLHVNECTNNGAGCTLAALGCDSIVKSNRELEQHFNSNLAKHFGLLAFDFDKFRDENRRKIENLNESVAEMARENVLLREEYTDLKRDNTNLKRGIEIVNETAAELRWRNPNLKREIEKIAAGNRQKEMNESEIKEIRHESRAITEGARAYPKETVQYELELSGVFSASAQHKFSINNLADKVERSTYNNYQCKQFYLHNYKLVIWIRRFGDKLYFLVILCKGKYDEELSWPLKRRMRWKVLDADDSDKVLAVQNFSYDTENDLYREDYNKPLCDNLYPLVGSRIKQNWSEFVRKYYISILVEME